jgi:hypothetical protein
MANRKVSVERHTHRMKTVIDTPGGPIDIEIEIETSTTITLALDAQEDAFASYPFTYEGQPLLRLQKRISKRIR